MRVDTRPIGFRRHLRAEIVPGEAVYLVSPRGTTALCGNAIQKVAPLLDGSLTLPELRKASEFPAEQLDGMLDRLTAAGLVGFHTGPQDAAAGAYWDLAGVGGPTGGEVSVVALGGADAAAAERACRAAGLTCGPDAPFTLVVCDDYLDPALAEFNAVRLADGRPWLPAKPCGSQLWVGPVFRPGTAGACWSCLAVRLRSHRRGESHVRRALGLAVPVRVPEASLAATRELGLQTAALEAAKWLAGLREERQGALWTLDTLTLTAGHHPVAARPQCPDCGDAGMVAERTRRPVVPVSRPKGVMGGNGHRALSAERMWERFGRLADPVTGITERVVRDPQSPSFLHCYRSGPNLALPEGDLSALRAGLRMRSGGKGRTDVEARVSALCEAVERYSATRFGDEETVRGSYRELAGRAVHPGDCMLFDERQYADRERWNASGIPFEYVPERFDEEAEIEWTPMWSLTGKEQRLLPAAQVYFGGRPVASIVADSNGNAAGGSVEDAIVQGFLELVERDAVALWWYNRTRHAAVDLTAFGDPWVAALPERFRELGRSIWVLDLTPDLGIPVMAAVSRRTGGPAEDIMLGFGAHLDPAVALSRAVTELGQMLPSLPSGTRGYAPGLPPHLLAWLRGATVADQSYLLPDPGLPARTPESYGYVPRADLGEDLEHLVGVARSNGLEVLVLDQTRPDLGLPVVKVVVPGLRHFWARFAPGRLFEVPVRLGRLSAPTRHEDLNPIPLFL
ncbi:TOMM precursor leader peptide-binding protein [Streptomyces brevispora]|uniref:Ribosomal protein S12 methylthiotransferase accessory factor n=1 Tax=Streptomyces brevispora TaxID=887462 RepID=A0A561TYJ0_9ACTN|nr:TOMM precursor leader peptide-binding protein [Streptomyces brevispora]TWF92172.1 ribosomal protein S12 methylthiotransferase accessory factor [Streptomyces brevispora]WSC11527.1 TOMM precursor leader peptide-binding protein [Streptomyces brevispora]WSC17584.1 TOMM precursor leader peptide-binding protein [Streptomyces brevispora]